MEPIGQEATQEDIIAQISRELEAEGVDVEDYAWGGDGSDPHELVRTHVEAALIPTNEPYPPELERLLHIGDPRTNDDTDSQQQSIGFTQEHVPALLRMARDRRLNVAPPDSDRVWGPLYALQALAQLDVSEHIEALLPLFDLDDEWFDDQSVTTISAQGEAALEPLQRYLNDDTRWIYGRGRASRAIQRIGERSAESRMRAIQILSDQLAPGSNSDPLLNGFILISLFGLEAVEALPTIRAAFEREAIDETIAGDWESTLSALGQTPDLDDPLIAQSRTHAKQRHEQQFAPINAIMEALAAKTANTSTASKKKSNPNKNKRKLAAASRKTNRKKK